VTVLPDLPLESRLSIGFITGFASGADARRAVERADARGFDSLWVGDHIAFALPILDPLLQLAQAAAFSSRITLGTAVYLLPLRHPVLVAKQIATLDHLSSGRLVFGVGVGGEFPAEYAACGVPVNERGARLGEAIPLLKALLDGGPTRSDGRFYPIPETRLLPPALQPGGPPIWCGGRSDAALRRMGRLADGWISYVVDPERYSRGLETIARAAAAARRRPERFGTGHLLFTRVDSAFEPALEAASEHLSLRYAMDFRKATRRYAALGRPEDVAERIDAFRRAGVRHLVVDTVSPPGERDEQLERFAREVRPLL
jgi:probable F420-dependent oxidoreductase